jgi:hypothetical protein
MMLYLGTLSFAETLFSVTMTGLVFYGAYSFLKGVFKEKKSS